MKLTAKRNAFRLALSSCSCASTPNELCFYSERESGGANRDRTGDLLLAKQALSQLSYGPWAFALSERPLLRS